MRFLLARIQPKFKKNCQTFIHNTSKGAKNIEAYI